MRWCIQCVLAKMMSWVWENPERFSPEKSWGSAFWALREAGHASFKARNRDKETAIFRPRHSYEMNSRFV